MTPQRIQWLKKYLLSCVFILFLNPAVSFSTEGENECLVNAKAIAEFYKPPKAIPFKLPGMQIASLTDETLSSGATLFYFPKGAWASFDARGGSVASVETTLLEEGSYSNNIDAIVFAGGSTMGLEVSQGVRKVIFDQRKNSAGDFDFIPSVPGAIVYDYGGRLAPFNKPLYYPTQDLGVELMNHLSEDQFMLGRAGAGINTTCNKICESRWGGQGLASGSFKVKGKTYHLASAVVLNAVGDAIKDGKSYSEKFMVAGAKPPKGHKQNTTLSLVSTDYPLDRNQLKRISVMVHTSMGESIRPFHASTDGDILFAVTTGGNNNLEVEGVEEFIAIEAAKLMKQAIHGGVKQANYRLPKSIAK